MLLKCTAVQRCVHAVVGTFTPVRVGRREKRAEFAVLSDLCIYYPFVQLFCISNVRKASFQHGDKTHTACWNSFPR